MNMLNVELIVDARCATGESPVWDAAGQSLWWVDIPVGRLHRWHSVDGAISTWTAPEMLGCIARSGDGWIAAAQSGLFRLTPRNGGILDFDLMARVTHPHSGMRFNDGRCDRQGRFWAGTMLLDMAKAAPVGGLYRHTFEDTSCNPTRLDPSVVDGLIVPNGLAFSPDGRTMYLSDSHPSVQTIWAFDYDTDAGLPSNRRLFVDMRTLPGRPDGAAIDADGGYWICGNDAGCVHRFTPDGRLDRTIPLPVKKPAMCAFGGPGLETLFITSIRPEGDVSDQPLAGGVFAVRPGTVGLLEPVCRG
jgi:sugar lactone lactonase YvrE